MKNLAATFLGDDVSGTDTANQGPATDELAATAGETGRTADQARPILLAAAAGESPHAAPVRRHAAKDCDAPISSSPGET